MLKNHFEHQVLKQLSNSQVLRIHTKVTRYRKALLDKKTNSKLEAHFLSLNPLSTEL